MDVSMMPSGVSGTLATSLVRRISSTRLPAAALSMSILTLPSLAVPGTRVRAESLRLAVMVGLPMPAAHELRIAMAAPAAARVPNSRCLFPLMPS